jgi:hypothetical protein
MPDKSFNRLRVKWALRRNVGPASMEREDIERRALLDKPLSRAMQAENDLLVLFLTGTKRMARRVTASQMAAAAAASFLPRLPLIRYGVTNLGAISLTV